MSKSRKFTTPFTDELKKLIYEARTLRQKILDALGEKFKKFLAENSQRDPSTLSTKARKTLAILKKLEVLCVHPVESLPDVIKFTSHLDVIFKEASESASELLPEYCAWQEDCNQTNESIIFLQNNLFKITTAFPQELDNLINEAEKFRQTFSDALNEEFKELLDDDAQISIFNTHAEATRKTQAILKKIVLLSARPIESLQDVTRFTTNLKIAFKEVNESSDELLPAYYAWQKKSEEEKKPIILSQNELFDKMNQLQQKMQEMLYHRVGVEIEALYLEEEDGHLDGDLIEKLRSREANDLPKFVHLAKVNDAKRAFARSAAVPFIEAYDSLLALRIDDIRGHLSAPFVEKRKKAFEALLLTEGVKLSHEKVNLDMAQYAWQPEFRKQKYADRVKFFVVVAAMANLAAELEYIEKNFLFHAYLEQRKDMAKGGKMSEQDPGATFKLHLLMMLYNEEKLAKSLRYPLANNAPLTKDNILKLSPKKLSTKKRTGQEHTDLEEKKREEVALARADELAAADTSTSQTLEFGKFFDRDLLGLPAQTKWLRQLVTFSDLEEFTEELPKSFPAYQKIELKERDDPRERDKYESYVDQVFSELNIELVSHGTHSDAYKRHVIFELIHAWRFKSHAENLIGNNGIFIFYKMLDQLTDRIIADPTYEGTLAEKPYIDLVLSAKKTMSQIDSQVADPEAVNNFLKVIKGFGRSVQRYIARENNQVESKGRVAKYITAGIFLAIVLLSILLATHVIVFTAIGVGAVLLGLFFVASGAGLGYLAMQVKDLLMNACAGPPPEEEEQNEYELGWDAQLRPLWEDNPRRVLSLPKVSSDTIAARYEVEMRPLFLSRESEDDLSSSRSSTPRINS